MTSTMSASPGRNDPCACGSGRKFKRCCLDALAKEDAPRLRIRRAEGRVVDALLPYALKTWGRPFLDEAWQAFFVWEDVPADMAGTPEFGPMFIPWLTVEFVPDREAEAFNPAWPTGPVCLHWLANEQPQISDDERKWIQVACRSPMSVFVVEAVAPARSVDLKDILTGRRFHVLEHGASRTLKRHDVTFTRVVTLGETSVMFGATPFVIKADWHTRVIDWREQLVRRRLMTRADLVEYDIEIRELYHSIAAEVLNPTPPQLSNTDGDPIELTELTFDVHGSTADTIGRLRPLASGSAAGEESDDDIEDEVRDSSGVVTRRE